MFEIKDLPGESKTRMAYCIIHQHLACLRLNHLPKAFLLSQRLSRVVRVLQVQMPVVWRIRLADLPSLVQSL